MPAIPISHVLPRETFAPAWEDSTEFGRFQPSLYRAYKCRFADLPPEKYADENTTRIVFVIYIFSDFTRVRFRGKRMKNIPQSWVWADRFPFNDLFHAIIYFIARINVDSSLSPLKARELQPSKKGRTIFFFNFLEFSMLQRKNFVAFYKKKKVPSNFIDRFPVQQIFSRDDPFYHRANQCYHMPLNIRKLQSMKRIFLLFFFFFKFHTLFHFQGKFHWIFVHRSTIISFIPPSIHRSHIPSNTRKLHSTRTNGRIF